MPNRGKNDTENMESILCCLTPRNRPDLEWLIFSVPFHWRELILLSPEVVDCK